MYRSIVGLLLLASVEAQAAKLDGKVVGVTDGDTITVLDQDKRSYKVRLSGIDAPEKSQAYGQVSKRSLSDLVYQKPVIVEWYKKDRYGRVLGEVLIQGVDANVEQLKRGLAWHYRKYMNEQSKRDRIFYSQAESAARSNRLGLWQEEQAVPPWEWRRNKKTRATEVRPYLKKIIAPIAFL